MERQNILGRVLIVDNDDFSVKLAQRILSSFCDITVVTNGVDAISECGKSKFDVIIMDINLGAQPNGILTTQSIRQIIGYENTPVIAYTAYAGREDRHLFLSHGLTHFAPKPIDIDNFTALIKKLLTK